MDETKRFELKPLRAGDVFTLVRLINIIGTENIRGLLDGALLRKALWTAPKKMTETGRQVPLPREQWTDLQLRAEREAAEARVEVTMQALGLILQRLPDCQDTVMQLLSVGLDTDRETVENLEAGEFLELLDQYISRDSFADFFSQAWRFVFGRGRRNGSSIGSTAGTQTPPGSSTEDSGLED